MGNNSSPTQSITTSLLINNFPFTSQRDNQASVLGQICNAFNSNYRYIILEAPTGFGKSPVAIAVAMTLGSSYIVPLPRIYKPRTVRTFLTLKEQREKITFLV